jgi:hypothetical protein
VPLLFVAYAVSEYQVPGDNPVRLLVKLPAPLPSVVLLAKVLEAWFVVQQTPRAVTGEAPSELTLPPHIADVVVIELTALVKMTGKPIWVTTESLGTFGLVDLLSFLQLCIKRDAVKMKKTTKMIRNGHFLFIRRNFTQITF